MRGLAICAGLSRFNRDIIRQHRRYVILYLPEQRKNKKKKKKKNTLNEKFKIFISNNEITLFI